MLFLDILSSNIYYIYIILMLYWVSEYISKIWIGNDINLFFPQNLPYLLSYLFVESLLSLAELVPSLSRVDEWYASRVFAESESCNIDIHPYMVYTWVDIGYFVSNALQAWIKIFKILFFFKI